MFLTILLILVQDHRALKYYNTRSPKIPKIGAEIKQFFEKKYDFLGLHVETQNLSIF